MNVGFGLQVIERQIETGDSEQIFQKAIQEQGRGQVHSVTVLEATSIFYVY